MIIYFQDGFMLTMTRNSTMNLSGKEETNEQYPITNIYNSFQEFIGDQDQNLDFVQ